MQSPGRKLLDLAEKGYIEFQVDVHPDTGVISVKMTIIVFLVDTSASMNQRTYLGTSLLDVAKAAVETFMKVQST